MCGPFTIQRVHVNGNITMELRPGLSDGINVSRVIPYHEATMPPPMRVIGLFQLLHMQA